jgi:hypothetical protein
MFRLDLCTMLKLKNLPFVALSLMVSYSHAQIGGVASYDFLNLPNNARLAGIGGVNVSHRGDDVNMWTTNPAVINEEQTGRLAVNVQPYYAGIVNNTVNYAWSRPKSGLWAASLNYLSYGTMDKTDPTGNVLGTFSASDYALSIGKSFTQENYRLGLSVKWIGSQVDEFRSYAIAADIGGLFVHPDKDLAFGLAIRNVGAVLQKFTPESDMNLPFQVVAGGSFKPENMPVRFSGGIQYLNRYDITYLDPNKPGQLDANGEEIKEEKTIADIIGRHFVFGAELVFSKNFNIRAGYNYLRRRELRLEERSGGAGFSIGAFVRIKRFDFGFTRAFYHVAGGTSVISVTTRLSKASSTVAPSGADNLPLN